jgi:hypothetical protein
VDLETLENLKTMKVNPNEILIKNVDGLGKNITFRNDNDAQ